MIDILQSKVIGTNKETWYKLAGTSADTKPTGEFPVGTGHTVANGSRLYELDTEILYELKNNSWEPVGQAEYKLQDKTVTPTTSQQEITCDEGNYGLGTVTVKAENLIEKTITANGEYLASDDEADGYSKVTVNTPQVNFKATPEAFTLLTNISDLNVIIPNGVTSIGNGAFNNCTGLKNVEIPSSVTNIDNYAFQYCSGLTNVVIPNSVTRIGSSAFNNCSGLTNVVIPNSVTSIGNQAFQNTGLTNVEIPSSVTSISSGAFNSCLKLTKIIIHKAQGSITGAPWGATNATIVWDEE